jgi:hypothetical protein
MYFYRSAFPALFFAFGVFFSTNGKAQFREDPSSITSGARKLSVREFEFFEDQPREENISIPGLEGEKPIATSHKSGYLAAGLSLILPGLGEYYVGDQIWRGLIFTILDAGLWYGQFHFLGRGDDSTTAFHIFADTNWSALKYADTLNHLLSKAGKTYQVTGDPNDPDYFSKINKAEDSVRIVYGDNGAFPLTHALPERGSQQFYELISKYIQFTFGWKDFKAGGPLFSSDYERHAEMRENMNQQYEIASYFLYGLFLNRVLSAIDAVLLAKDHNSPLRLEGQLRQSQYPNGAMGFIPTANIRYKF